MSGLLISIFAALLAAVAAIQSSQATAAWIAALTTVVAAVTAHGAASRYEYQEIEYSRTADELENLRARPRGGGTQEADDDFVERCERIISIQNEGWMTRLGDPQH